MDLKLVKAASKALWADANWVRQLVEEGKLDLIEANLKEMEESMQALREGMIVMGEKQS